MVLFANYPKEGTDNDVESATHPPHSDSIGVGNEGQYSVAAIGKLVHHLDGINGDLVGIKVESLQDAKSLDSLDSTKSTDSIKSITSQNDSNSEDSPKQEQWYSLMFQILIPFIIAGFGTIGAGLILGEVENYPVFSEVDSLYILVPAIIGLKGNLDMCLASRLSTQANLGNMKMNRSTLNLVIGNIGLVQIQAIVAAIIVSLYATFMSTVILKNEFHLEKSLLVICCSTLTATLSCFVLDFVLTGAIFVSHKIGLNPDNLATPLAASIGDVVSISVLSQFAGLLYTLLDEYSWIYYVIIAGYVLILLPGWILLVINNEYTKKVLTHGWVPVISALFISGIGGLVLDNAVGKYRGYVVFQPIVNGVGGNLVSVYASRISTMLHKSSLLGILPPHTKQFVWPWTALFGGVLSAKTARILLFLALPGQTLFVFVADIIYNKGVLTITAPFVFTYLTIVLIQVMILLYIGHLLIHTLWKRKIDPDTSAIPYLTALGDLFGSSLLLAGFMFLESVGQYY